MIFLRVGALVAFFLNSVFVDDLRESPEALDEDDEEDDSEDLEALLALLALLAALDGGGGSSTRGMTGTKLFCTVVLAASSSPVTMPGTSGVSVTSLSRDPRFKIVASTSSAGRKLRCRRSKTVCNS